MLHKMPCCLLQVLGAPLKAALSMLSAALADTLASKVCRRRGSLYIYLYMYLNYLPYPYKACFLVLNVCFLYILVPLPGEFIGGYTGDGFHGDRRKYTGER